MDPGSTSARTVLGLLRYVDRDLNDPAAYEAMETPPVRLAGSTALKATGFT